MTNIKIEIGQYREINQGALKASFTLVEYPEGRKTRQCKYFIMGEKRWWTFPQEKIDNRETNKPDYIPYVSYIDKGYAENLKAAVLDALKNAKPEEKYAKKETQAYNKPKSELPAQTPTDWTGELPF